MELKFNVLFTISETNDSEISLNFKIQPLFHY
jgi:hypothetical protein